MEFWTRRNAHSSGIEVAVLGRSISGRYLDAGFPGPEVKAMRSNVGPCVYCGKKTGITREHVFSKGLFLSPRPKDLITVPACEPCNSSYSEDEEYFRFAMGGAAFKTPTGRRIWDEKIVRSTFRRSPRLRQRLAEMVRTVNINSPTGLYLGSASAMPIDLGRVHRVMDKIVRGLFAYHTGSRLMPGTNVAVKLMRPDTLVECMRDLLANAGVCQVGDGSVIKYRWGRTDENPQVTAWAFSFYDSTFWGAFTGIGQPSGPPFTVGAGARSTGFMGRDSGRIGDF